MSTTHDSGEPPRTRCRRSTAKTSMRRKPPSGGFILRNEENQVPAEIAKEQCMLDQQIAEPQHIVCCDSYEHKHSKGISSNPRPMRTKPETRDPNLRMQVVAIAARKLRELQASLGYTLSGFAKALHIPLSTLRFFLGNGITSASARRHKRGPYRHSSLRKIAKSKIVPEDVREAILNALEFETRFAAGRLLPDKF
jgi:hypothetical protein